MEKEPQGIQDPLQRNGRRNHDAVNSPPQQERVRERGGSEEGKGEGKGEGEGEGKGGDRKGWG
jgi:hypothetical protein